MVPLEIPMKARLVVLPDVHRDLSKAKAILRRCNVTDENDKWMCYDTVVVQMGDQIDGGARVLGGGARKEHFHGLATSEDVATLNFFTSLADQAPRYNSVCVSLIGNHEIMNAAGLFQYADLDGCPVCTHARELLFRRGSPTCKRLADTRACVLKVGPFLLSHAGVTPDHLSRVNGDLNMYNRYARAYLVGEGRAMHIANALIGADGLLSHRAYQPASVTSETMTRVQSVLAATRTSHMITAHNTTPGMVPVFGNNTELIVFDPGMSRAVADQKPAALDIREGEINVVKAP